MSAPAFTPAPWAAREVNDIDIAFSIDCGKAPVADVYRDAFAEANARLIAAAPDLYAIVDEWLALGNNLKARRAIRDKARAVLTKIDRGES